MVGSAAGIILAMLIAGIFIAHLYRTHLTESFRQELDHHLIELTTMTRVDRDGTPNVTQPLSDPQFNIVGSGLYWQVAGPTGARARSRSLGNAMLPQGNLDGAWGEVHLDREKLLQRSVLRRVGGGASAVITIASDERLLERQIARFRTDLTWSMIVIGMLLLGGALLLVRFGLAPARRLDEEVDRLRHGQVDRLSLDVPAEFRPLVQRLNALLDAQAQLIARSRAESGSLAHNLRTPLALISDEAEQLRMAGQTAAGDYLLSRCEIMRQQIDRHLVRAAAGGVRGAGTFTDVAPLAGAITDAMARLHAERGLHIRIDIPSGLRLPCDRGDLAEMLSNLIDNACKFARHEVVVAARADMIEVRDDGPGIPPERREDVLKAGARLNPSVPGSGLGLAMVSDLLSAYDGELILTTAPEGGLQARVHLSRCDTIHRVL